MVAVEIEGDVPRRSKQAVIYLRERGVTVEEIKDDDPG